MSTFVLTLISAVALVFFVVSLAMIYLESREERRLRLPFNALCALLFGVALAIGFGRELGGRLAADEAVVKELTVASSGVLHSFRGPQTVGGDATRVVTKEYPGKDFWLNKGYHLPDGSTLKVKIWLRNGKEVSFQALGPG